MRSPTIVINTTYRGSPKGSPRLPRNRRNGGTEEPFQGDAPTVLQEETIIIYAKNSKDLRRKRRGVNP